MVTLNVTYWGHAGDKIILIHGGVQGSKRGGADHFATQKGLVDDGFHLLVPDRPGHGRSEYPGRPDDAEADGELIAELLGDGAHLVGHSFGGCVALAAAARRPEAMKTLTLIEPGMQLVALDKLPVILFLLRVLAALKLSFSEETRVKRFAKVMRIPEAMGGGATTREEFEAMGRAASRVRVPSKETLIRQLAAVKSAGLPLMVVTGGWSPGIDATADVVASLGNGKRVTIASPHHFPQAISDEFNQVLIRFIRDSSPTP
jgi:pimeloyl-ACP methyl ester carboxylesterase